MGNSTLLCPAGSIWHLISNLALPSTCCQRNPPTVPPSISPLISHKTQSPWRPVPCKQSQLTDSLASPLCPIVPPVCFPTASRLVRSSTIRCPETRKAVIISLATVDLESSGNSVAAVPISRLLRRFFDRCSEQTRCTPAHKVVLTQISHAWRQIVAKCGPRSHHKKKQAGLTGCFLFADGKIVCPAAASPGRSSRRVLD